VATTVPADPPPEVTPDGAMATADHAVTRLVAWLASHDKATWMSPGEILTAAEAVQAIVAWARETRERIGAANDRDLGAPWPPSAREQGEISDPRMVLRGQMLDNTRRRQSGWPA
jgi:hypothetical protein